MKAGQIVARHQIEIVSVPDLSIADQRTGTLLVKPYRGAICGSDIPYFTLQHPSYPLPLGQSLHECIGFVVDSKSSRFKEGDEVLSVPIGQTGLAEYFISNDQLTVHLSPSDRPSEMLMSQPLGTVIWACRKLGNLVHQNVVVFGQGPMGQVFNRFVSNLGAKTIIAIDLLPYRLEVSKKMHATHTIDVSKENLVEKVREITNGQMADLVIEVVGHQTHTINTCIDLVKRNGTILAFGVPDELVYEHFSYGDLFRQNIRLISSVIPDAQADYPLAMDMIAQNRIDVAPILTHHLSFDEAQYGFELFTFRQEEAIKVILDFEA